jgi:hypothetical protein
MPLAHHVGRQRIARISARGLDPLSRQRPLRLRQKRLDGLFDLLRRQQLSSDLARAIDDEQRRRAVRAIELRDRAVEGFAVRELRPGNRLLLHELVEPIEVGVDRDANESDILPVLGVQLLE